MRMPMRSKTNRQRGLQRCRSQRGGYILPLLGFLLVVLIGMLGLVVDGGLMMSTHRQANNAADAAARACAQRVHYAEANDRTDGTSVFAGDMSGILQPLAESYALTFNKSWKEVSPPTGVSVVVNRPPLTGPFAAVPATETTPAIPGNRRYVEVRVTYPLTTWFIQVLGVNSARQVAARAVAGYESRSIPGAGLIVLDPDGNPGLTVGGSNAAVVVNAAIFDYSMHQGLDESTPVNTVGTISAGQPAATIGGGATIDATAMFVSGGVDVPANYSLVDFLDAGTLSPPFDPYFNEGVPLPTPTTANGVVNTNFGDVSVGNNQTVTLSPGIYSQIRITGGTVTFLPGIYVLKPPNNGQGNILSITGGTVTGTNVMFYNTGNTYDAVTGGPDPTDLAVATDFRPNSSDNFQGVQLNGTNVSFTPPNSGAFNHILFYQRRFNTQGITVNDGFLAPGGLAGWVYAKWANLALAGSGTYNFGIVVGTMSTQGNAVVNVPSGLPAQAREEYVFLVE